MTTYTAELKEKLRVDIRYIDGQLDLARGRMAAGDKEEAWAILDGLLEYFDFKKHFPDLFVNEDVALRFQDMYEALRAVDDLIEIDAIQLLAGRAPLEWRPGYTREEILRRLRAFLEQIESWLSLDWFEGDEIRDSLEVLREKIEAFIRFFLNDAGQPLWGPVIDVREAKKGLWRSLSEQLPFAEVYELLMTMDRDLTYLVFRFRLHLAEVTLENIQSTLDEIADRKHAILAIINATRARDEAPAPPPDEEGGPVQPPPGWDDLQPFPPAGYAFHGASIVPVYASRRPGDAGGAADAATGFRRGGVSGWAAFAAGFVAAALLALLFCSVILPAAK